jgi:hypothetical protein
MEVTLGVIPGEPKAREGDPFTPATQALFPTRGNEASDFEERRVPTDDPESQVKHHVSPSPEGERG